MVGGRWEDGVLEGVDGRLTNLVIESFVIQTRWTGEVRCTVKSLVPNPVSVSRRLCQRNNSVTRTTKG